MDITLIKKNKSKKINEIYSNDRFLFSMSDEDLFKLDIYEGKSLTDEEVLLIKEKLLLSNAKTKALNYISYKIRTEKEVVYKLTNLGFSEKIANKTVNYLREVGYLNDFDYAKKYFKHANKLKKIGIKLIRLELENKGIDTKIIEIIVKENIENEISKAEYHLLKKIKGNKDKDLDKLKRYLLRKGFTFEVINTVVNKVFPKY